MKKRATTMAKKIAKFYDKRNPTDI